MFFPEYTITPKTLKNIALIEYARAVVENTVILQNWEQQLQKQTQIEEVFSNLMLENINIKEELVKKVCDGIIKNAPQEVSKFSSAYPKVDPIKVIEIDENVIKKIQQKLSGDERYRSRALQNKPTTEEVLAEVVELFDWVNSLDANDTYPIVVAAIIKARLEQIAPFDLFNNTVSNWTSLEFLSIKGYSFKNFLAISPYFYKGRREYMDHISKTISTATDYSDWIEYYAEAVAVQASQLQEKVKLLAKDTKIAKVTGRVKLTPRQEKIIEYMQDYGILQNKDFATLFPEKSEDSILRDLKILIDMGLIQKAGSTKSSRYELK